MKIFNVQEANNFALGANGFDEITETSTPPPGTAYCVLLCDTDATFSATSIVGDNLSSQDRAAGRTVFGVFSEVAWTSGTILGYYFPIAE